MRGACADEIILLYRGFLIVKNMIEKIYPGEDLILIGPAPESVSKDPRDMYKMVLYMRHRNRRTLVQIKDCLERYIAVNKGLTKCLSSLI